MPLLKLHTSAKVPDDKLEGLLKALSALTAESIGKPEGYVMTIVDEAAMCMGGELGPAAFADLRSIGGLSPELNKQISSKLCALLQAELDVDPARVFINFTDVGRSDWGHNGSTFG